MHADSSDEPRSAAFISEPITPERGSFSTGPMSRGLASPPRAFAWRGRRFEIAEILEHTKQSAREGHSASGELYLRRQQFVVRLDTGQVATIYVERQARPGVSRRMAKSRWFLFTITSEAGGTSGETA
jgi:hypothetical protein